MNISVREITAENWIHAIKLTVKGDQVKFVAPNATSIAQSKFESYLECYGIYNDDTMVGFTAFGINPDDDTIWIARYMIDQNYQRQGYGKDALTVLLKFMQEKYACSEIFLDVREDNALATNLYVKAGFMKTGKMNGHSPVYRLDLTA